MLRSVRMGLVAAAVAAVVAPVAAAAAEANPTHADLAGYCRRYDAYQLGSCGPHPRLPSGALGAQLGWVLHQLAGGAESLTVAQVRERMSAGLLRVDSADKVLLLMQQTLAEHGPMRLVGYSYPPRADQLLAIVRSPSGQRGAVALTVSAGLIDDLAMDEAPPTLVPSGRYSGWFDVGGRRLFLRCTGHGGPTVVFDNGLTTDWYALQNRLSARTRVCSYDPARMAGAFGRSDSAPAPRDAIDRVRDLHALLDAAHVPGPYVLAGHSNGGLFTLLYASRHPSQVVGLVLIDGVHPAYHRRSIAVAKRFVPPAGWPQIVAAACGMQPVQRDAEQMDICRGERETRVALAEHPLRRMPLAVLSRTPEQFPPGTEPAAQERLWQRLQDRLAALEPGSWHVVATRSGHDIQHDQPELVLAAVERVLEEGHRR